MKRIISIVVVSLVMAVWTYAASATCTNRGCVGKITKLYPSSGDRIYIGMSGENMSPLNCNPISGVYIMLEDGHIHFEQIYSTLLASFFANQDVYLRIYDDGGDCRINYITISK